MRNAKPRFMTGRVFERERAHRRTVLATALLLLLFSMSPVYGHHVAEPLTAMLAGRDHLLNICLVALHQLLAPVHVSFHALVGVGLVYAVGDRLRAVTRLRAALRMLDQSMPIPGSAIDRAATAAKVDPRAIRVIFGPGAPAFTAGLWRPRIFVADELAHCVRPEELAAIIAHEDAHRRRRDPLRLTIWRFLACLLFFLPVLRRLEQDMADEAEVAADDDAVLRGNVQPVTLASALLSVAQAFARPVPVARGALGFHTDAMLSRRVRRLLGEDAPVGTHLTRRSALGAAVALSAVWLSGLVVAHPLPAQSSPASFILHSHDHAAAQHCAHEDEGAFSHLFCRGWTRSVPAHAGHASAAPQCPHEAEQHSPAGG